MNFQLIEVFEFTSKEDLPEGIKNVANAVNFNDTEYFICEVLEGINLETSGAYSDYLASLEPTKQQLKIVIADVTSNDNYKFTNFDYYDLLTVPMNAVTELSIEVREIASDKVFTHLTEEFFVPVAGVNGSESRTIKFDVLNGSASRSITWLKTGAWKVTESEINSDIDGVGFKFKPLKIKVYE